MSTEPMTDAQAFYQFLGERIHVGGKSQSPEELLEAWRIRREYDETVAAVEEGLNDAEAGRMRPLRDLLSDAPGGPDGASS